MSRPRQGKNRSKTNNAKRHRRKNNRRLYRIRTHDDPILSQNCDPVEPGDDLGFVGLMKKALSEEKTGVGLAAPQIGIAKRVIITRFPTARGLPAPIAVMVNPVITHQSDEAQIASEGCLSYPGVQTMVSRPLSITVEWSHDLGGETVSREFEGMEARIICHEVDHLNGVCAVGDAWRARQRGKQYGYQRAR